MRVAFLLLFFSLFQFIQRWQKEQLIYLFMCSAPAHISNVTVMASIIGLFNLVDSDEFP